MLSRSFLPLLLIFYALFLLATQLQARASIFDIPILKDVVIEPVLENKDCKTLLHKAGYKTYPLGSGDNANLYRMVNAYGHHEVYKHYHEAAELKKDLHRWSAMNRALLKDDPQVNDIRLIHVIGVDKEDSQTLIQESILGETAASVNYKLNTSARQKAFREYYVSRLKFILKRLYEEANEIQLETGRLPQITTSDLDNTKNDRFGLPTLEFTLENTGASDFSIRLHPFNVLVDTQGNFIIIDMY